ncbi:MAG: aldolase [Candidatus Bathyarchaeia archaeon]
MVVSFEKFLTKGKSVLLAYDHGLEHGPTDFNEQSVDPSFVVELASKAGVNALALQKGVAEKYYDGKVPLVIKVNGKTNILGGEPLSRQICSVEEAISLGASAVGYTIYPGSIHESIMLQEFGQIVEEAHKRGIPAIAWVYPRGAAVKNDTSKEMVAYAARVGLEVGADAVKIKYTGDAESFSWAVKAAGKARVFMSGGPKAPTDEDFLRQLRGVMDAKATGVAVGRNVWQNEDPIRMAKRIKAIVIDDKSVEEALKI